LLRALGYDPDKFTAEPRGGFGAGLLIKSAQTGQAEKFFTTQQLERMGKDPEFLRGWADCMDVEEIIKDWTLPEPEPEATEEEEEIEYSCCEDCG